MLLAHALEIAYRNILLAIFIFPLYLYTNRMLIIIFSFFQTWQDQIVLKWFSPHVLTQLELYFKITFSQNYREVITWFRSVYFKLFSILYWIFFYFESEKLKYQNRKFRPKLIIEHIFWKISFETLSVEWNLLVQSRS